MGNSQSVSYRNVALESISLDFIFRHANSHFVRVGNPGSYGEIWRWRSSYARGHLRNAVNFEPSLCHASRSIRRDMLDACEGWEASQAQLELRIQFLENFAE